MTLPPLNMDMVFESRTTGIVSHKTAEVRAPGLGQGQGPMGWPINAFSS